MKPQDYLGQVKLLDLKIQHKLEQRADLMARAACNQSPTLTKDKVQSSPSGDRMARTVEKYVDLEREIDAAIDEYLTVKNRIITEIHSLNDARYVDLLMLKYVGQRDPKTLKVHYLRLEEIACTMRKTNGDHYSFDHIAHLHGEALQEFWKSHRNHNIK